MSGIDFFPPGSYSNSGGAGVRKSYGITGAGWKKAIPTMFNDKEYHNSVTVDGKVYMIGGYKSGSGYGYLLSDLDCYDPITNTRTSKPAMPINGHSMACGTDGSLIVIAGGYEGPAGNLQGSGVSNQCHVYDPLTETWTAKANLPMYLGNVQGTVVNGVFYVFGGRQDNSANVANVFAYNIAANTWTAKANLPSARNNSGVVAVGTKIFIIGGDGADTEILEYDTVTNNYTTRTTLPSTNSPVSIGYNHAVLASNGKIYITPRNSANVMYIYNPVTYQFEGMTLPNPLGQYYTPPALSVVGNVIYASGGNNSTGGNGDTAAILAYDVSLEGSVDVVVENSPVFVALTRTTSHAEIAVTVDDAYGQAAKLTTVGAYGPYGSPTTIKVQKYPWALANYTDLVSFVTY